MRFRQLEAMLRTLVADETLHVFPGPVIPEYPGRMVVVTRTSSPGLSTDGIIDTVGWQIRTIGEQFDYESAEDLALAIDAGLQSLGTTDVQGLRLVTVYRVGGPPTPLMEDDAQRHHFVCSYLFGVYSAVAAQQEGSGS